MFGILARSHFFVQSKVFLFPPNFVGCTPLSTSLTPPLSQKRFGQHCIKSLLVECLLAHLSINMSSKDEGEVC
jgi:hypothetical protein